MAPLRLAPARKSPWGEVVGVLLLLNCSQPFSDEIRARYYECREMIWPKYNTVMRRVVCLSPAIPEKRNMERLNNQQRKEGKNG